MTATKVTPLAAARSSVREARGRSTSAGKQTLATGGEGEDEGGEGGEGGETAASPPPPNSSAAADSSVAFSDDSAAWSCVASLSNGTRRSSRRIDCSRMSLATCHSQYNRGKYSRGKYPRSQ